jgi:ornithine cyclodeaminase
VRIVSLQEVQERISMGAAIAAMRKGFADLHAKQVVAPDEFVMHHPQQGDIHIKGAHLYDSPWMVAKVASAGFRVPGNHGCMIGLSSETGAVEVLVDDGGWLTEVRTAAAVALSVDLLARGDAKRLAIIGVGVQAAFQLEAARLVREFSDICVFGRTSERVRAFAAEHQVSASASLEEALANADVVLCATTSRQPILTTPALLAPGTHVTASGADMVGKHELGSALVLGAHTVTVDDVTLAKRVGILQGIERESVLTIGDLLYAPIVRDPEAITVAGLSGLGMQDAAIFDLL